ncbi:MAG: AAA family ATPase [Micropruina sp.]|nr:AAA family ATPase [Micropruina sp.]
MRLLLVGNSPGFAERLTEAVSGAFLGIRPVPFPTTPHQLFAHLNGAPTPDLALLEPGPELEAGLTLAAALVRDHAVNVILVSDQGHALGLRALRAGVRDVLDVDSNPQEIRDAIDRAAEFIQTTPVPPIGFQPGQTAQARGRVITVASPKGGVGKTTVATNLAVGIAKRFPQSTVLVDLDIHFGDVSSGLNLNPEYSLPDVTQGPASRDSMALKTLLTLHETGLYVIPGSESPAAADNVTPSSITHLLDTLAAQFAYVVVDTAPGLSEHTLAVLDTTDTLVLVTSLDVPGVRGLRKELDTLTELGMLMGSRKVVLNFFEASRGLTVADVEATIRTKVDVVLPQSSVVPISVNQGIPLLQSDAREPVTKALHTLVDHVAPRPQSAATKGSLFSFGRRAKDAAR